MERINERRETGLTATALRTWGFLFVLLGAAGMGILQNGLLGIGKLSVEAMVQAMQQSETVMILATVALILQAAEACAVPFFAFLLVEGAVHTSNMKKYMLRVAILALICELPYNLAIGGGIWVPDSRNPVFGILLCLIMLYLYGQCKPVLLKILITAAGVVWCEMLGVAHGSCTLLLVATLWAMRKKPQFRLFVACSVAVVCSVISPFYLASPMSFIAIHMYNGKPGERNRLVNYLCYPVILILVFVASKFF